MPDLDIGDTRVFELLHDARPVVLEFGGPSLGPQAHRVTYEGPWVLPVLGEVPPPTGVLIRPDGHVGWVGQGTSDGFADALAQWCGTRG